MRIALIGYGTMGHAIETEAKNLGVPISRTVDTFEELEIAEFASDEVAIEFTEASQVWKNVELLAQRGVNVVVGTTGWYEELPEIKSLVERNGIGFLWSANFSLGVNLFWRTLETIAKLMDRVPEYDVFGHEIHHCRKKDAPSGTALKTAELLLKHISRKQTLVTDRLDRGIQPEELQFSSLRGGSIPGTHRVYFDSPADTITLTHEARNRSGFANGAIRAAQWLSGKKGYFEMDDFLENFLGLS